MNGTEWEAIPPTRHSMQLQLKIFKQSPSDTVSTSIKTIYIALRVSKKQNALRACSARGN